MYPKYKRYTEKERKKAPKKTGKKNIQTRYKKKTPFSEFYFRKMSFLLATTLLSPQLFTVGIARSDLPLDSIL